MNQLQNLLHDALISTEHVQQCAIVRRKDCSVRASSVGFNVSIFSFSLSCPNFNGYPPVHLSVQATKLCLGDKCS